MAALTEQSVKQLLKELAWGKPDICTGDAGGRENRGSRGSFHG